MSRIFVIYPASPVSLDVCRLFLLSPPGIRSHPFPRSFLPPAGFLLGIFPGTLQYFLILNKEKRQWPHFSFSSRKNGKVCLFTVSNFSLSQYSLTLPCSWPSSPPIPICSYQGGPWPSRCWIPGLISRLGFFKMCVFSHCCIPAPEAWHPVGK